MKFHEISVTLRQSSWPHRTSPSFNVNNRHSLFITIFWPWPWEISKLILQYSIPAIKNFVFFTRYVIFFLNQILNISKIVKFIFVLLIEKLFRLYGNLVRSWANSVIFNFNFFIIKKEVIGRVEEIIIEFVIKQIIIIKLYYKI